MIYFTSDTHFNHENVIQYSKRPFASLEDMECVFIHRWNQRVKPGDLVYHLGDFALSWGAKHAEKIDRILASLNGTKILIKGNHDRKEVTSNWRWSAVYDLKEIKVDLGGEHRQKITLCHYAMRTWPSVHYGAWMLYGHSHGSMPDTGGLTMDVGVDCHDYRPISIEEVAAFMQDRKPLLEDHHQEDADGSGY